MVFIKMYFGLGTYSEVTTNEIIDFGGNIDIMLLNGEWWRLLTSMFIHGSPFHFIVNMLSLFFVGIEFEKKYNSKFLLLVYFASGLIASSASAYFNLFTVSCGASGAIFGLVGAQISLVVFKAKQRKISQTEISGIIISLMTNILFNVKNNQLDAAAYVGGFLGGFLLGMTITTFLKGNKATVVNKYLTFYSTLGLLSIFLCLVFSIQTYRYNYFLVFKSFAFNEEEVEEILENPKAYENSLVSKANVNESISIWRKNLYMLCKIKNVPQKITHDIIILKQYARYRLKSLEYFMNYLEKNELAYIDSMDISNSKLDLLPRLNYYLPTGIKIKNVVEIKNYPTFQEFYNGKWIKTTKDSASFYRIGKRDSLGNVFGYVSDYYITGNLQMRGEYYNGFKNGTFFFYYENGNYSSYGGFKAEKYIGKWKHFYNNGKLKEILVYTDEFCYVQEYYDEDGKQLVKEGNGKVVLKYNNNIVAEEKIYKSGIRNGKWSGNYENGKPKFVEYYNKDKFLSGVFWTQNGVEKKYYKVFESARPIGIDTTIGYVEILMKEIIYPKEALIKNIKGITCIEVKLDSLGNIIHTKPLNYLGYGCEEEAIRVIKNGPKFAPAKFRGIPVTYNFTVSIPF